MTNTFPAFQLTSPTGATINAYCRLAEGPARAVVQVNHGLAEHAARYGRFAEALAAQGFHTYAHDHRGHGGTTAPDAPPRVFARESGVTKLLDDVSAVRAHIRDAHPGLPVISFGHSMGGLVALNHALRKPGDLAGLAVWNANFSAGLLGRVAQGVLAFEKFRRGSDTPSQILPKLTFSDWAKKIPDAKTPFDWLSRDPAEVAKYIDDPFCGWDASVSMWQDVFRMIFAGADDQSFAGLSRNIPVMLRGGERDPATDGGKAVTTLAARMAAMGFTDIDARIFPETRHESLNEINRADATAEFIAWAGRIAASASG